MKNIKQSRSDFFEDIKNLQSFGDVFDLQATIEQEIKSEGIEVTIKIIDEIIEAVISVPHNIPLIIDILDIIFEKVKTNEGIKNQILNRFIVYTINACQETIRVVAFEILSKYYPKKIANSLIDISRNKTESLIIRKKALECLKKELPEIDNLSLLLKILENNEEEYMLLVLDVLEINHQHVNLKETQFVLENISRHQTIPMHIRCRVIELLGIFGDIGILERICLLSGKEPKIQESLQKMLNNMLSKPLNILGIRFENFEHLIKEFLIKLGYSDVKVTPSSKDAGVDVIGYKYGHGIKDKKYKMISQCKLYTKNRIEKEIVEKLVEDMKEHEATSGLLITTSKFSREAIEFAKKYQHVELIDRDELQSKLDKVFGDNYYCIRNLT